MGKRLVFYDNIYMTKEKKLEHFAKNIKYMAHDYIEYKNNRYDIDKNLYALFTHLIKVNIFQFIGKSYIIKYSHSYSVSGLPDKHFKNIHSMNFSAVYYDKELCEFKLSIIISETIYFYIEIHKIDRIYLKVKNLATLNSTDVIDRNAFILKHNFLEKINNSFYLKEGKSIEISNEFLSLDEGFKYETTVQKLSFTTEGRIFCTIFVYL